MDPQTCPNFRLWQMAIPYPCIMLLHGASYLDQRCLKTRNSEDECTFPPNIFATTPKITPKPHFGGPFNAKPIIQRALRQSHVNVATSYVAETLRLYSYRQVLGGVPKFSLNVNFIISETTGYRKLNLKTPLQCGKLLTSGTKLFR